MAVSLRMLSRVKSTDAKLDRIFGALAHPVRRAIIEDIRTDAKTVVELAKPHKVSLNAISKHIKRLEESGLIRRQIDGSFHRISFERQVMKDAMRWMTYYAPFWNQNLQNLKSKMESDK